MSVKSKLIWLGKKIDVKCQREPPHPLNGHINFGLTDRTTLA